MIQRKILKPHYYILFAAALMLLCLFSGILRVSAAEGFELYADNPGIHVTAGDSVSFDLYLSGSNAADTDVALSVVSMPDGFTGYFKSGSYEVSKVHARGDSTESAASFQVTVPSEAEDGTHEIVLRAVSDSGYEDELTLSLTVSELKAGESNFYVEYPDQEGVSGASFS